MASTYVPPLPAAAPALAIARAKLIALVAVALLALAGAAGLAAATLVPRSHDTSRTTFLTP